MATEFWLTDDEWAKFEPLVPMHRRRVKPTKNWCVISGILHVRKYRCRWRDCPEMHGSHTTVSNRFNRWSKDGIWQRICRRGWSSSTGCSSMLWTARPAKPTGAELVEKGAVSQTIGRNWSGRTTKIHTVVGGLGRMIAFKLSAGQFGDVRFGPLAGTSTVAADLLAGTAYDSNALRAFLTERGSTPVIRPNPRRKNVPLFDEAKYRGRNVGRASQLPPRRLAPNFRAAVILGVMRIWWK
jgi:transposase